MATYKVLYWQEIPTQIKADDDDEDVTVMLDSKFMLQVDILAAKRVCRTPTIIWRSGSGARKRSESAQHEP